MAATMIPVLRGKIGFPSQPKIQGEIWTDAVIILAVEAIVVLPPVFLLIVSLGKSLDCTQQEISERIARASGARAAERKLTVALESGSFVELPLYPVEPESKLVL